MQTAPGINVRSCSLRSGVPGGPQLICTEATTEAQPLYVCRELALRWSSDLQLIDV